MNRTLSSFIASSILTVFVLAINGCDSNSSNGGAGSVSQEAHIEGYVSDIHGPIQEGTIEVKDKNLKSISSINLDGNSNHFALKVAAGTTYPILLVATPPEGKNQNVVRATVTNPLADRMDITDITSLVVDAALALGGLTESNISKASGGAIGLRQRQGVSAGSGGGGAGAGQSGGGAGNGGHGGHDMTGTGDRSAQPMQNMQH